MSLLGRLMGGRKTASPASTPLAVAPGERVYAIGDIHGRADLLVRLLEMISTDAASRGAGMSVRIMFLGDYVDRGLDTSKVVTLLRRLHADCGGAVRLLSGNHEAAMLAFLDDPVRGAGWLSMGAFQTFESYEVQPPSHGADADGLTAARDRLRTALGSDERFLRDTLVHWERSGSVAFVHAAVDPALSLEEQPVDALLWGEAPGFLDQRGIAGTTVVHGHFVSDAPDIRPWRIGVDTGAYFSGRLTALWLGEREHGFLSTSP